MDYTEAGQKYWVILSEDDCIELTLIGYEYFDLFFTEDDWAQIIQLPVNGISFFHFDPTACHFLEYALNADIMIIEKYETLSELYKIHESKMIEYEWPFPHDWEFDILSS